VYNASKGVVQMLAKILATQWGPHGICVSSIGLGCMLIAHRLDAEFARQGGEGTG